MDARRTRAAILAALLVVLMGASYRTPNFLFQTADPQLAEAFGKAAEKYRHDLAIEWTGQPMPNWSQPCVVTANVGPHLGAGGATTFVFDRGEVFGWRMNIQGSAERILDSVLPHETTHMIFACHFRAPLPRWADEGGATSVEHISERMKHRKMLVQFLQTGRGIAFNQMFAMTEYPADVMPLYAQAQSLVDFLIQQGGRRRFVAFLEEGMKDSRWAAAIDHHYGIRDLGTLQNTWLAWVARGCPALTPQPEASPQPTLVAGNQRLPRPEPNLIWRVAASDRSLQATDQLYPVRRPGRKSEPPSASLLADSSNPAGSPGAGSRSNPWPSDASATASRSTTEGQGPLPQQPMRAELTRPQPIEQPRQIILEWTGR
jgi:hypothetical protein